MVHILVRCPYTGFKVQQWLEDDALGDDALRGDEKSRWEGFVCQACNRVHLINKLTGKTPDESQN